MCYIKKVYLPLHEVSTKIQDLPKTMGTTPCNITCYPTIFEVYQMVEKNAHSRVVIHPLTNNANIVG